MNEKEIRKASERLSDFAAIDGDVNPKFVREICTLVASLGAQALVDLHRIADAVETLADTDRKRLGLGT